MLELYLPTNFSDSVDFFSKVASLQNEIRDSSDAVMLIRLPDSDFLNDRTDLFLLSCLVALGKQEDKKILVDVTFDFGFQNDTFIKLFQLKDTTEIIDLVRHEIFGNIPIKMTNDFEEEFVSLIAEIYANAKEHSKADFIMGISYKSRDEDGKEKLCFCCYDTGVGIIGNVRRYRVGDDTDPIFETFAAGVYFLQWALKSGNSTKFGGYARGLGLTRLLQFSEVNHGFFRICNEDVLFEKNSNGEQTFKKLKGEFLGSFFEMHIMEDPGVRYKLKGE